MEVHIRGIPERASEAKLADFFVPILDSLSIKEYNCRKKKGKPFANLLFLHIEDGRKFLNRYGQATVEALNFQGRYLQCQISKFPADKFALKSLEMEAKERGKQEKEKSEGGLRSIPSTSGLQVLECSLISCGIWNYVGSSLMFTSYFDCTAHGEVRFNSKAIIIRLDTGQRIDIPNSTLQSIIVEPWPNPGMILTLTEAPRFSADLGKQGLNSTEDSPFNLSALLSALLRSPQGPGRERVPGLSTAHENIAGTCLVYRIELPSCTLDQLKSAKRRVRGLPPSIQTNVGLQTFRGRFESDMITLLHSFTKPLVGLPFPVAFQVQKLAQNCFLPPNQVSALVPEIRAMMKRSNLDVCVQAIRKLFLQIPFAGPDTEAQELQIETLTELLRENEQQVAQNSTSLVRQGASPGTPIIHRVTVTPAGMYLYGPEPESNNRVLRKYASYHDFFIRVQFCDEDGSQVRFMAGVSNDPIYFKRFKKILNEGIAVGGRRFAFLGFSHSSLRTQSCWFMAPFVFDGHLLYDRMLIKGLGDFSQIRSPAKCAARIGQAFSDTPQAVAVSPKVARTMADVERNNRVFSDGVGTMSASTLEEIWEAFPEANRRKTSVFQIRYSGAKGMVALDSRLRDDSLNLRKSMIKFPGSTSSDIEICGAAHRPLPLFLNQQNIKILEDMGVSENYFLFHQKKEIDRLRQVTSTPATAAKFLNAQGIGQSGQIPGLIRKLHLLGYSFKVDPFLRDVVEVAVLIELRALKYKTRIPVKNGYTLHGIMDETGVVKEGQIFCIIEDDGEPKVITGKDLIITRSPALHPGDVQLVEGIDVPEHSPLKQLRNCICFSQWGERDLPSQLSGGDLDGDLYHLILDIKARPRTFPPAEYETKSPIDLGQPIERDDMTEFFLTFMNTDQLGRIANLHKVLADQKEDGTLNKDCIKLAELHSTAVDFSKTGIPINVHEIPRDNGFRPDFMAPGPHVVVEKGKPIFLDASPQQRSADDDEDDDGPQSRKYYESDKILGKLYRVIDEAEFLSSMQQHGLSKSDDNMTNGNNSISTILEHVWSHVRRRCLTIHWEPHLDRARGIREEYEYCILNIAAEYSTQPSQPLTEIEVFVGNIIGRSGAQSKRQQEMSVSMKQRFSAELSYVVDCIKTNGTDSDAECLERSIACFHAALEKRKNGLAAGRELVSFRYVAAAVCLREVERAFGKV